jgi:hypothetical protein
MVKVIELKAADAKAWFLKGSSYFNGDFPTYVSFEPLLKAVAAVLGDGDYAGMMKSPPKNHSGVNYSFVANKDGRFAWRPFELMHPAIYVSLVNLICSDESWKLVQERFKQFQGGSVTCCSLPVLSLDQSKDQAAQVASWWQEVEQRSLTLSLDFSHVLHTDVTDCYGALYTHSVVWALHGIDVAKAAKGKDNLFGDKIDTLLRAGRSGQTNGIAQGSVLMDFVAELVLGYVDELITTRLGEPGDFRILRYRDDYRIFANNDVRAEEILKVVSDELRKVGMRLGVSKTFVHTNVVEGSVKADKLAAIDLQDLGKTNAKTLQKQLLRLHSFGRRYPNSGALRRLVGELHSDLIAQKVKPDDVEVQVAIAADISVVSPLTFPAVAGALSHLISLCDASKKVTLWNAVLTKMSRVPYNGYLQIWLQRVCKPKAVGIEFVSDELICQVVNGAAIELWNNEWIASKSLLGALASSQIVVHDAGEVAEVLMPEEVELFNKNADAY